MKKKKESRERKNNNKTIKKIEKNNNVKIFIFVIVFVLIISTIIYYILINRKTDIFKTKYGTFESSEIQYKAEYKTKEDGVKYILFTIPGVDDCNEKIEFVKKEVDSNNNLNLYFDFRHSCGVCAPYNKTFEIPVSDNENINEIKAYYRVVSMEECDSDIVFCCLEEVNKYMPLEFSKNPDTLIRIIMDYKPLDKKVNIKEQKLEKVLRNGFTIVEWGGRKID